MTKIEPFWSHKIRLLFGPFYRPKRKISLPFYILQLVKSLPFHIPEAWKRYPFWARPPCIGHHREYPRWCVSISLLSSELLVAVLLTRSVIGQSTHLVIRHQWNECDVIGWHRHIQHTSNSIFFCFQWSSFGRVWLVTAIARLLLTGL